MVSDILGPIHTTDVQAYSDMRSDGTGKAVDPFYIRSNKSVLLEPVLRRLPACASSISCQGLYGKGITRRVHRQQVRCRCSDPRV